MICPKCGMEYQDQVKECSDCHVPLVSPEEAAGEAVGLDAMHPVKLASFSDGFQADMLEGLLKDLGIPVLRRKLGSGGYMQAYMGFSVFGEELYVDEADYERAKEVLGVLETDGGETEPEKWEDVGSGGTCGSSGSGKTDWQELDELDEKHEKQEMSRFHANYAVKIAILAIVGVFVLWAAVVLVGSLVILFQTT